MYVYTYSEARQKLAIVLEQAENTGKVIIQGKNGRTFALIPEKSATSPLNVPSIKANITTEELVDFIRERRERQNNPMHLSKQDGQNPFCPPQPKSTGR
jgi:hypothetical protein